MKLRSSVFLIAILTIAIIFTPVFFQADVATGDVVDEVLEDYETEEDEEDELEEEESNEENEPGAEEFDPDEHEDDIEEEGPLVSTVFFHEDIREALNEIALQTGVNIVYDETVVGTVTLDIDNVPLEEALDMLLITGGYTYEKIDEDFYIVGRPTPESAMYDRLTVTETIHLDYITADEAVSLLPPYYADYVTTSPERDDVLNITAPEPVIEDFKRDLEEIDYAPDEVLVEVVVTEVSTEVMEEYGTDMFGLSTAEADEEYALDFDGAFALEAAGPAGQLMAELEFLQDEDKAEIQANPSIRVSDGEPAELFVGEERVLIMEVEDDDDVLEEVDVGVSMEVTPDIVSEDEVLMEIAPDVSHFTEVRDDQLVVRRSEMASNIRAESGETVTMAGMTLDEVVEYESRVPILGDIPLIRWLFREETTTEGEREMLVMITPEIIE